MVGNWEYFRRKSRAGNIPTAAVSTAANLPTFQAVSHTLVKNGKLIALIETFVSNYVKKELNRDNKEKRLTGSGGEVHELPRSPLISDSSNDVDIPSIANIDTYVWNDSCKKESSSPSRVTKFRIVVHAWRINTLVYSAFTWVNRPKCF